MRILVVEDDAILGLATTAVLEDTGHVISGPAFDVAGALEVAANTRSDLALVDINLAGNDEGIGLARELRDKFGIPTLFVSGQPAVARANMDVALGILNKPFAAEDLVATARVAEALLAGNCPLGLPPALEIFVAIGKESSRT
ncbi:response regulator [uncultured Brevundimonas sp.]|uniref:response regulator n=1 Tax=uncultured Brevundimonas sp. TaxID=213418 RepID=UPI0030EBD023|tara:strand:+ start:638 stop:1066 length:429 start_codon:yes stop_codon:yes gene_type:complete